MASLVILAWWAYQTDRDNKARAREEEFRKKLAKFKEAAGLIPELVSVLRKDLSDPQKMSVRDIFVVSRELSFEGGAGALVYYTEDHPELDVNFEVLVNNGYVADVTRYNVKKYRMSEDFVALLLHPSKAKS